PEEDRQLLALGGDLHVLTGENAAVELRREIFCNLSCQAREELVAPRQLPVEARDHAGLVTLQPDEGETADGDEGEIKEQILEREDVGPDRLADDELLYAAHVADLPVGFGAIGAQVMATNEGGRHDDRGGQPDAAVENRARNLGHARMRILPQALERPSLEVVEGMRRTILERMVREKAELRVAVIA